MTQTRLLLLFILLFLLAAPQGYLGILIYPLISLRHFLASPLPASRAWRASHPSEPPPPTTSLPPSLVSRMSANKDVLDDLLIAEVVARNGGYEATDRRGEWPSIANSLGARKDRAEEIKQRYEDMLLKSAEQDQKEEDNELDYEVEAILDRREENGQVQYLVKWKDDDYNQTWEPSSNLSCPGEASILVGCLAAMACTLTAMTAQAVGFHRFGGFLVRAAVDALR